MARGFLIALLLPIIVFSCKTTPAVHKTEQDTRDSLLKRYFVKLDSLPFHDTTTIDYKLLKAYYFKEDSILKMLQGNFDRINTKSDWQINLDSCVRQDTFKDIKVEEVYRFVYRSAFCPYRTSVTIKKNKDSIVLNTLVFQYAWDNRPCIVIEQHSTQVDSLNWDKFQQSLQVADFWGAKEDNGDHGVDGSTLEVYGFIKGSGSYWNPDKSNYISRWCPGLLPIMESFGQLLKLSKTKKGCMTVT